MARPLRIEYAGAVYHVTSRGDRREDIFHSDEDRENWLDILAQVCERFNWRSHAWCLMDNHYHLLIETAEANLSQGMRQLNGVYTQHSNRRHQRVGHVFQGRYKAILVQKEAYLLELCRYVVLNPIRAKMVNHIADWHWSSYLETVGAVKGSGLSLSRRRRRNERPAPVTAFNPDWILAHFSENNRTQAIQQYQNFIRAGIGLAPIWQQLKHQVYLGDEDFIDTVRYRAKHTALPQKEISEVTRLQRRALAKPLTEYRNMHPERNQAIIAAYASGAYTMAEIAQEFQLHYTSISRIIKSE
jgi:REP element-mobilizing transposase RayT